MRNKHSYKHLLHEEDTGLIKGMSNKNLALAAGGTLAGAATLWKLYKTMNKQEKDQEAEENPENYE